MTVDRSEPEPDVIVIHLDGRRAISHSELGPEGYGNVEVVGPDGELTAPHIGLPPIALADVLAATGL